MGSEMCIRDSPYHDPFFSDCFWTSCDKTYTTIVVRSSGTTCSTRYAKVLPMVFRFLPSGARKRFRWFFASSLDFYWPWSSSHRSTSAHAEALYLAVGTRETRHVRFTLGALSFSSSPPYRSSTSICSTSQTPIALVLDETSCG